MKPLRSELISLTSKIGAGRAYLTAAQEAVKPICSELFSLTQSAELVYVRLRSATRDTSDFDVFSSEDSSNHRKEITLVGPESDSYTLSAPFKNLDTDLPWSTVYATLPVDDKAIRAYLHDTNLYNMKTTRWELPVDSSPSRPFPENELYKPFQDIISSILKHFKIGSVHVENTHSQSMMHLEDVYVDSDDEEVNTKTAPDLCIMCTGGMFRPIVEGQSGLSYFQCGSPVEIMTERLMLSTGFDEVTLQVAVYARQCFVHQPNRFYTCAVITTEELFHLLVFDRNGAMRIMRYNLHKDAVMFVRVIIGISLFNSMRLSCLDPNIRFIGDEGNHLQLNLEGFIPADSDDESEGCSYQIVLNEKPFLRKAIRGRGTRCWLGTIFASRVHVIVKDSRRPKDHKPEWELLRKVVGLDGVGQMVAYTTDETTSISKFRAIIVEDLKLAEGEMDRIFTRIILKAYGPPIHYFRTPLQLLYTFRDAVAGHRALWMRNILHRDVGNHNILIGKEDAQTGNRGVLIDLDMAIDITTYVPSTDARVGTRALRSVMTLRPDLRIVPQDHRDDLESFYYILLWICSMFIAPRKLVVKYSLQDLEAPDDETCANFKRYLFERIRRLMSPWFDGTVFLGLLRKLGNLVDGWIRTKLWALDTSDPKFPSVKEIRESVGAADHDLFLKEIDATIEALLNDKNNFGHSEGIDTTSLLDHKFVELNDIDISPPTGSFEIENHAPASNRTNTGKRRDRSFDSDDDELEKDHVRKK
ncbi:hypothetical protein D9619_006551 [Psilocybe cf. subviscida]|uniref:Fungal-type protein kinase domain-containing protein n=1 Tax=Psilocybe cf. subviscida TaxID=2480587 RepID=A0A8H5EXR5_9AGAR|nr:hypothetical protein D9619_006551 [Psilocybe cf. subviscida]